MCDGNDDAREKNLQEPWTDRRKKAGYAGNESSNS